MPEVSAVQAGRTHGAIARAAAATGVDFDFLLAQARIESGLDPNARAGTSSAAGLYQFIGSTWLDTLDRHGSSHGLGGASDAIVRSGGRAVVADPATRAQILGLRYDPDVSAMMAAELARDNAGELRAFLGREPDHAELYLAHFLGVGGAREFLGALRDAPHASAAALLPGPARANRAIFHDGDRARTVVEVMDVVRAKMAGAGNAPDRAMVAADPLAMRRGAMVQAGWRTDDADAAPRQLSMAETLARTFAVGSAQVGAGATRNISAAYGKIRAFGL